MFNFLQTGMERRTMKFLDFIRFNRQYKKAFVVERIETGCVFGDTPKVHKFVICQMDSGKKGLFKQWIYTPPDPGDQHFYKYEFLCYV